MSTSLRGHQRSMLERIMKWRLEDAWSNMNRARRENTRVWRESKQVLRTYGVCDAYLALWRREKEDYQVSLRAKLRSKVYTLVRRYSNQTVAPESVRGIVVGDQQVPEDFSTDPRCYGDVELSADERSVLSLPPKYAMYSKIDATDCKAQVEKGIAKLRWSIQKRDREEQSGANEPVERESFKSTTNAFDFRLMRATDQPENQVARSSERRYGDQDVQFETRSGEDSRHYAIQGQEFE